MTLRARFTLTLALAAFVPISIAAIITTQVVARSYRDDYEASRRAAEQAVQREIANLEQSTSRQVAALASRDQPFVGMLLQDLANGHGGIAHDPEIRAQLREQSGQVMRGFLFDILTITGPDDVVLVSPHLHGELGIPKPEVRKRALATGGKAYFARDKVMTPTTLATVLVCESAQLAHDGAYSVALWAGRRVPDDFLAFVRRPGVDARVVTPTNEVLLPSAGDWAKLAKDALIKQPLLGPDGTPVAYAEVAVSDNQLPAVLRKLTLTSAALAALALVAVIGLGLLVARRVARDLDRLVEGSLAASRGELEHRVPVRSKDEIGAVASAFNFMMEDLKTSKERLVIAERIAAWQEIARRLAHEIKNPLTPIQMAMDTLRKSYKKQHPQFPEILDESTATVLEEADRLKHIVAEFSDFARLPKPEFARIDLNEVVRSALALYQGAVPVTSSLAPDLPQLDADKNQLTQVLLNLVENARDAIGTRTGGKIAVSTRRGDANDRALLVVEDNGPGVPGELKDKVFAPYFTTKHGKGGTGLGLAIVHRIVNDHGGRITIGDAPGGGARFAIELPLRNGTALLASRI
jgi:signal transduction histidine kinase